MSSKKTEFSQFEEVFWSVTREMGKIWKDIFDVHFPGSQSQIVYLLARKGPLKMSEISNLLGLTGGAITAASDKLIANGYVTRLRDQEDRRMVHLTITEDGRNELQRLRQIGRMRMTEAFRHLEGDRLTAVLEVFEQAQANIEEMKGREA